MKNKAKPVSLSRLFLVFVLLIIGVLPLIAVFAQVIPPSFLTIFEWLGLGMPFLVAVNVIVMLLCLFSIRKYALIPLVSLLGSFYYYPLVFQWNNKTVESQETLKVATYNVQGMSSSYGFPTIHNIADFAKSNELDILHMQEVPPWYNEKNIMEEFPSMKFIAISSDPRGGGRLVILSKYPLSEMQTISAEERPHLAFTTVVDYKGKKIMLLNCHLQTTSWNQLKKHDYLTSFRLIYKTMSDNFVKRANQAEEIKKVITSAKYPLIVTGDFNAPPVSYSYDTVLGDLKDSFREAGNGYSYTYRFLKKFFRIDYIFFTGQQFEAYNYRTENLDYSDHLPVLVDFVLKK